MTQTSTLTLSALPALGTLLQGGTYAGCITQPDGTLAAVILLPGMGEGLTWAKAKAWAKKQGGVLPTRPVAALLYAYLKGQLRPRWHWTSDAYDASSAWYCDFGSGFQNIRGVRCEACAVAVRLIHIEA